MAVASGQDHARRTGQHGFQRQVAGLGQAARGGGVGEAGVIQQRGDQRPLACDDSAALPDDGGDRGATGCLAGRERSLDPPDQHFAAFRMSGQSGQAADLRQAIGHGRGDRHLFQLQPEPLQRRAGGRRGEIAIDHQVGLQREDLLDRAANRAKLPGLGEVHRRAGRIPAVMRNGQNLRRIGDLRQDRIGTGIEADNSRQR